MTSWQLLWLIWCLLWLGIWLTAGWLLFPLNLLMAFGSGLAMIPCFIPRQGGPHGDHIRRS